MISADSLELTPELIEFLVVCVRDGNFRHTAIQRSGIPVARVNAWITKGDREIRDMERNGVITKLSIYGQLTAQLDKAEGDSHAELLTDVIQEGDAALKLKFLQLRFQKLYAKNPLGGIGDQPGEPSAIRAKDVLLERLTIFIAENADLEGAPDE